jgi:hypothetical protein
MSTIMSVIWDNNKQPDSPQKLKLIIDWWKQKSSLKPTMTSSINGARQYSSLTLYPITEITMTNSQLNYKEGETKMNVELTSIQVDIAKDSLILNYDNTTTEFQY